MIGANEVIMSKISDNVVGDSSYFNAQKKEEIFNDFKKLRGEGKCLLIK